MIVTMFSSMVCPSCGEAWPSTELAHFCATVAPEQDPPYAGAASVTCPACGQPKGRGYGCAVLPEMAQAAPVQRYGPNKAGQSWVMVDAEFWDRLQDAHSVDSGAAAVKQAADCHCVVLLPALKRWVDAKDAYWRDSRGLARWHELSLSTDALEAVAREVSDAD